MTIKRRVARFSLSILLVWVLCCGSSLADVVDRIVAVVNNDIITQLDLNKATLPYMKKIEAAGYPDDKKQAIVYKLKLDMLNRMIERKLADQEAKRLHLSVSDQEVDRAIENLKQNQLMTQEDLEKALEQDGLTLKEYRENMRQEILRPKLINFSVKSKVIVTDQDVKKYYEKNTTEFSGTKRYHLYNILIKEDPYALTDKNKKLDLIESIKTKLDTGEDFKNLSKEYSEAPNASQSGDLGFFDLETFSQQLQDAISKLNTGEYTQVINTSQGYQLFFIEEIQETGGKTLEQATKEISEKLYNEIAEKKFRSWIESLQEKSYIKIML